jgi:hypothetical protein
VRRMAEISGRHRAPGACRAPAVLVRPIVLLAAVVCVAGTLLPLLVLTATASPAAAASAAETRVPRCPPDCGAVAAGDPLLVGFMTANPGVDWQAFPAADSQSYVNTLRRNLSRLPGTSASTNVAAARWNSVTGGYSLLITLVSSDSLAKVRLQSPLGDAADLCSSAGGAPTGSPTRIAGIPGSASGSCAFRPTASVKGAVVAAFIRGNVAVLIEISSRSTTDIDPLIAVPAAHEQYAAVPPGGVPISSGGVDVEWILFWLCLLAALAFGIVACARRRGSWRGPFVACAEAFGRRKVALGVSVVAVVGAMAFSMLDSTIMRGFGEWFGVATYGDFWQNWADATYTTFAGGYGHIYVLDRTLETAPALQVIIAPIARLASGLSFPYPSAVLYPTAYWVAGPLYMGGMALPICACDRWLSGMGVTDIRRRLTVLGVMAITLPPIPLSGHPEDLIALGAMLYGIAAAFEERPRATGWWLGIALAFQPFAFLAIPIAFIFLKRRQWLTALGPIVAVPLAFLIVPVVADPSVTLPQLLHQKVFDVFGYISPTWNVDPGVAAYIRSAVALAAIPAAIVLARFLPRSRRQGAALVIWTVAMLFALRVFEPELFPYFMAPTLALAPICAARLPWWRLASACALAVWLTWWLHIAVKAEWSLWLILVAQLCLLGWLAYPGRVRHSPTEPTPSKKLQTPRPTDRADRTPQLADRGR